MTETVQVIEYAKIDGKNLGLIRDRENHRMLLGRWHPRKQMLSDVVELSGSLLPDAWFEEQDVAKVIQLLIAALILGRKVELIP